jgi:hypothetical protein
MIAPPRTQSYWPADRREPILETTVGGVLREAAARAPDAPALVAGTADPATRRQWTYSQLLVEAAHMARAWLGRFQPGEHPPVDPRWTECLRALLVLLHRLPARPTLSLHGRVVVAVVLALAAVPPVSILWLPHATASEASVGTVTGAGVETLSEPFARGTTRQSEPDAVPTARVRYDIPGWDSMRRPANGAGMPTVEPVGQPPSAPSPGENLIVPVLLGLVPPSLGWVGLSLVLRNFAWSPKAPESRRDRGPDVLVSGLRERPHVLRALATDAGSLHTSDRLTSRPRARHGRARRARCGASWGEAA